MAASRRGRVGQARGRPPVAAREPVDQPAADGIDGLVEQDPGVAAALLEAVEQRDPGRGIAGHQRLDEPIDGLGVGQTEEVADAAFVDRVRRRRQELIEHRLGVAHAPGGKARDEPHGGRVGRPPIGLQDPGELALDLRHGQAPDVVALEARQDGRAGTRRARSRRT